MDETPRLARPGDRAGLTDLWLACFPGDTVETVQAVFDRVVLETDALVIERDGIPVSMVFLLAQQYRTDAGLYPVQYIYAAATLPAYRGCGLCRTLLETAFEIGRERGQTAPFLRPASPSLSDYYRRLGYRPFFRAQERRFSGGRLDGAAGFPQLHRVQDYGAAREAALASGPAHVLWDERWTAFAQRMAEKAGGGGFAFDGIPGCALCEPDGETLFIRELLCPPERTDACLASLHAQFRLPDILCRMPSKPSVNPEEDGFGLWYPLNEEGRRLLESAAFCGPYMGLALD